MELCELSILLQLADVLHLWSGVHTRTPACACVSRVAFAAFHVGVYCTVASVGGLGLAPSFFKRKSWEGGASLDKIFLPSARMHVAALTYFKAVSSVS